MRVAMLVRVGLAAGLAACSGSGAPSENPDDTPSDLDPGVTGPTGTNPTDPTNPTLPPPTGTGEVDPDVHNEIPAGYSPVDPVRLLFLGDSITEGYGASDSAHEYTALLQQNTPAWPGFDAIDLETSYPGIVDVIDVSEGGATTSDLESRQLGELDDLLVYPVSGETIVVVTIAGNDMQEALIPLVDAATVVDRALTNLGQIADYFLDPAKFPDGVFLYMTNVYEPSDGYGQAAGCFFGIDYSADLPELDRFNDTFADLGADRGFAVLDLRGHFLGHGFYADDSSIAGHDPADPTIWFAPDCIHPNDRGHHELRRLFHAAITGQPLLYELP